MKKTYALLILGLLNFLEINGQSFPEWNFRTSGYYGYAIGKTQNLKRLMLATGITNTFEKNIKAALFITFGVDVSSNKYNFITPSGNQGFSNNYFISVPITIKKYITVSKKSQLFWDFGLAPAYQFYNKNEVRDGIIEKKRKLGIDLEGIARFGLKTLLSKKLSFEIGLNGFEKIVTISKYDDYKISRKANSIMTSFSWDIK